MSDYQISENLKILVLIVEDDQALCREYASAIEKTSDIKLAQITGRAADAIELIKQHSPDVVVLDLLLENGDCGADVLIGIRSFKNLIKQPGVVVLTGNKNPNLLQYYTENVGADTYYTKSSTFNSSDFVEKIRKTYDITRLCGVNMPGSQQESRQTKQASHIDKIQRLESAISARLEKDGMLTGRSSGKKYLVDLIVLAVQNGGVINYVLKEKEMIVAKRYKTTQNKVSRNVSSLIHRTCDFVVSSSFESEFTPFTRAEKYRTPLSLISYYAEIFRYSLD